MLVVERVGASISVAQADQIIERASRSPVEGDRKVLVLDEFHLVTAVVGPKLLKTIEEPPAGTFFVVLVEEVTPDLVTLASRCVRIDVGPVPSDAIVERLVAEGVDPERADRSGRSRPPATCAGPVCSRPTIGSSCAGGPGTTCPIVSTAPARPRSQAADDLLAMIDDAMAPLVARHEQELADLEERVAQMGERGAGRKDLVERHNREQRRYRADELRFGLTTLARRHRDELATSARPAQCHRGPRRDPSRGRGAGAQPQRAAAAASVVREARRARYLSRSSPGR